MVFLNFMLAFIRLSYYNIIKSIGFNLIGTNAEGIPI